MPPLTDDLTPAELTGHEDAPLERFCRGGGEGDLAAAFFGFWGRPHHTSLLRGVVDLVIDLEIAAVQVDILDREPGALPCPETGMQEDQKQVAVAAAVGILLHEFQEGGLLLRGEGLPLFFGSRWRKPSRKEKGFQPAVPSSTAFLNTEERKEWSLRMDS